PRRDGQDREQVEHAQAEHRDVRLQKRDRRGNGGDCCDARERRSDLGRRLLHDEQATPQGGAAGGLKTPWLPAARATAEVSQSAQFRHRHVRLLPIASSASGREVGSLRSRVYIKSPLTPYAFHW